MMPSHVLLHALHMPHSESLQSTGSSHSTPSLQFWYSRERPSAGVPHSFASCRTLRVRHVMPPLQDLEQGSHSSHSSHCPSMHAGCLQGCVLQASVSSLSHAGHALPPCWGAWTMWRSRVRMPPPHLQLQSPQSDQRPQMQSTNSHFASSQALVSFNPNVQPSPPSAGSRRTLRERTCWPLPHVEVQAPHSCQSLTAQSCLLQGSMLHPLISTRLWLHGVPWPWGFWMTWRCL
mmetsp:Transcript_35837/g.81388  ORF Transcript_35837/g.81388 Transcript_35837/m.81388 type:complete len:233 (+) Transcript_35837:289-987(+)